MTYMGEALLSIYEDGIPLIGTFTWWLLTQSFPAIGDDVKWTLGLGTRFGIQYVNYTTLTRTPKHSAFTLCQSLIWTYIKELTG
ncbi:hypothetical protein OE88DRAFT_1636061 [Heliocybe sulcata]|uniref:Uncharacterized protein n=1 Tax=Heliocybe sulcata TaxID=5364 RepID=A0A5C3MRC5_9AGAM|nr:hypothetical protein OE88DRAFT_1636061 [Heliocybe sulcata]